MPLSWNEIRSRSLEFSKEWEGETSEKAEAKSFWDGFFNIFGIGRRRIASFERPVKKIDGHDGYIDLLWKGKVLVEHKSRGKDLDRAHKQALDYFPGLKEYELPKYIVVSDFERFRLYDLEEETQHDFLLSELHKNVHLFGFIAGYQTHAIKPQDPVNIEAAERMGKLHDALKAVGYEGHALEVYLVRLLFCLFADDTGIFEPQQFQEFIQDRTSEDGSDLGDRLATLFHVLNTESSIRLKNLDEKLLAFRYVNGKLFQETLPPASFDSKMRQLLLECCSLDWSRISPAIFGSLFQSIMDSQARRNLGAHYTSEENILKLLKPLFLDDLWSEFERVKNNKNKLLQFHGKLRRMNFLDPACGCGNFLVIAYRELRLLELEILRAANSSGQKVLDVLQYQIQLDVDQFHGIEIEEFPAQIAQVALWLMDHQMNMLVSQEFGTYFVRFPLKTTANIVNKNALVIDWEDVLLKERLSYIMGNPPFVGAKFMSDGQRNEAMTVFGDIKNAGLLDYVTTWYVKAAKIIQGTNIRCAFVSTNSITQGEQVGVLWGWLLSKGIKINFAHRTFQWQSEAKGKAAVHCVIIGFSVLSEAQKWIFDYHDLKADAHAIKVSNINPYLVDGPDIVLTSRETPICQVPEIGIGNKPIDGGAYLFTTNEKDEFIVKEPQAAQWFRRWIGSVEFINGYERWCLWLGDCSPEDLRKMPEAMKRVEAVRQFRLASKSAPTRKIASTPTRFHVENMPSAPFLVIPEVSSERRLVIPIGFMPPDTLCSNLVKIVPNATLYHFGILCSTMHMAWIRAVCGRLKSDYRYSGGIVYNNFPWPEGSSDKHKTDIEEKVRAVLDARTQFAKATLADLYDPLTMPPVLLKAHQALDRLVDAAYGKTNFKSEAERVSFLFELYQKYTSLLPSDSKPRKSRKTVKPILD